MLTWVLFFTRGWVPGQRKWEKGHFSLSRPLKTISCHQQPLRKQKWQHVTANFHFGSHMALGLQLTCQSCILSVLCTVSQHSAIWDRYINVQNTEKYQTRAEKPKRKLTISHSAVGSSHVRSYKLLKPKQGLKRYWAAQLAGLFP